MIALREKFKIPKKLKAIAALLLIIGILTILSGFFTKGLSTDNAVSAQFWGVLMYNTIFWTLICNASMFFVCFTTLAMGGWQASFRRVPEAISCMVPIFGVLTFLILFYVVAIDHNYHIYGWLNTDVVQHDEVLKGKQGFLNVKFYLIWTVLTLALWSLLGWRMRVLSSEADKGPLLGEKGKKYIWKNTVTASLFVVWFALTVGSTVPWFWMMSIDPHWYSSMYSWYTFASSFVSGLSLIALWVVYLKNNNYLELTNQEHLHDLGKFIFAFSIFWTYLWFAQFMLIWYANIPDEVVYFKHRMQGAYRGIFFLNLIINFVFPILLLMSNDSKRKYNWIAFMATFIILGHWMDFYQMVMGSLSKQEVSLSWFDFGVLAFFVGVMIYGVAFALTKKPLIAKYNPFLKESVIHHS
ncbi:MAG: hypothetical protein QM528_00805 [Phycisphaerales bacterium]|nr:hypothetical protein [Phycisphaerales bacterium]